MRCRSVRHWRAPSRPGAATDSCPSSSAPGLAVAAAHLGRLPEGRLRVHSALRSGWAGEHPPCQCRVLRAGGMSGRAVRSTSKLADSQLTAKRRREPERPHHSSLAPQVGHVRLPPPLPPTGRFRQCHRMDGMERQASALQEAIQALGPEQQRRLEQVGRPQDNRPTCGRAAPLAPAAWQGWRHLPPPRRR